MEDKEFIRPQEEFAPPREEFVPPKPEFAPPRDEFSPPQEEERTDGREHEQTTQPAEKKEKKRRINPLMVTAAAVTAAVVTVSGLTAVPEHPYVDDPSTRRVWHELEAQHYAYLEDLGGAMQAREIDIMKELAADERLRTLIEDDLLPFYEEIGRWDELVVQETAAEQVVVRTSTMQKEEMVNNDVWNPRVDERDWTLYLAYDPDTGAYQTVSIHLIDGHSVDDTVNDHDSYYLHCSWNGDGIMDMWEIYDDVCHHVPNESTGHVHLDRAKEIYHITWDRQHSVYPRVTVKEGTCSHEWENKESEDDRLYTWLENGTVTVYQGVGGYMDSEWEIVRHVTVRDGYSYEDGVAGSAYHEFRI